MYNKPTKSQEKFCQEYFWAESWMIKKLLEELETKTMDNIVDTYQFNIWFNEWLKQAYMWLQQQLENNLWSKPIQDINELENNTSEWSEKL